VHFFWGFHPEAKVRPESIVCFNGFILQLLQIVEYRALIDQELPFQNAIHPFRQRILLPYYQKPFRAKVISEIGAMKSNGYLAVPNDYEILINDPENQR
jgi:hypothetical protein